MQDWQSVGPHRYYADGDLLFWCIVDVMDESHIEQLLAGVDGMISRFNHSVLLVDCSQAHSLKPEARRRYGEWLKNNPHPHRASIFFSVKGEFRTFLLLAQHAGQLLSGKRSPLEIVDNEEQARRRVAELREQWAKLGH